MKIQVNGEWRQTRSSTLEELLGELEINGQEVATALDGSFVVQGSRAATMLDEGMRLDIVAPVQGG